MAKLSNTCICESTDHLLKLSRKWCATGATGKTIPFNESILPFFFKERQLVCSDQPEECIFSHPHQFLWFLQDEGLSAYIEINSSNLLVCTECNTPLPILVSGCQQQMPVKLLQIVSASLMDFFGLVDTDLSLHGNEHKSHLLLFSVQEVFSAQKVACAFYPRQNTHTLHSLVQPFKWCIDLTPLTVQDLLDLKASSSMSFADLHRIRVSLGSWCKLTIGSTTCKQLDLK